MEQGLCLDLGIRALLQQTASISFESCGEKIMLTNWGGRRQFSPPGQEMINLDIHIAGDEILSTFTVEVIATDYNQFALVWFQMSDDLESSIVYVYGESLSIPSGIRFIATAE